jgi:hypothetical protein
MVVVTFRFYESSNSLTSETILANTKEEAEDYLRTLKRNGVYKIQNLNIEHSFIVGHPTNFKVFSRDTSTGEPLVLDWSEKATKASGRVSKWTSLPDGISKKQNV